MPNSIAIVHTVQGQAWDQIARDNYGSEARMDTLLSGNVDEADVLLFSGETSVRLPGEAKPASVRSTPPWERM